ncbi:M67 family metallopeptidase [Pseudomonas sp. MAFF 302030]|uniref:M67 family metallopeptidase n=1 Tax=Pseudomonas morbosilactucae TaxID=2938197 RepID=A0A9X1YTU7_9PSED|nr:M67 family metallopeptidase [Pseudomonas morbosilactucae]MCK9798088.1 M67 family metallopeptidase [Pseudomonas morbosilactucae]
MLVILSELLEAALAHARDEHPQEACGVIAAQQGSRRPSRFIAMVNRAQSATFFEFDPNEQLRVWREMEARGEEPLVIYHSHTHSAAYPSKDDVLFANEPQAHYLILSTAPDCELPVRSFRIIDAKVTEETLQVLPAYVAV